LQYCGNDLPNELLMKIALGIFIPSFALILFLLGNFVVKQIPLDLFEDGRVNHLIKAQALGLLITLLVFTVLSLMAPESRKFLRFGDLTSLANPVRILGINPGDSWMKTGVLSLLGITCATAFYMYLGLGKAVNWTNLLSMLPFILIFSVSNSFIEEIISRYAVVGLLDGLLQPNQIMMASAIIFGSIHYFGNPGGPVGVLMAGFLGWFLAKSMIETQGIGVAWIIHLVQDLVIFTFILLTPNH